MAIFTDKCGFGKRTKSVAGQKRLKRSLVRAAVKKLKAAGKPVDLQAINKEALNAVRRRRQTQR